jgi:hypothetical protein
VPRSVFACRHCREPLGLVKPSGILHLYRTVAIAVIDHRQQVTVLRCPGCGQLVQYRGGRIEPDERKTA